MTMPTDAPRTRKMRSLVPVVSDADPDTVAWLAAESFYRTAAGDSMQIVEYHERHVSADEASQLIRQEGNRPDVVERMLGAPMDQWDWWLFEATAQVDVEFQNYLIAEGQWRNRQIVEWLSAERLWQATSDA